MFNGLFHIPLPKNEPALNYASGSRERAELQAVLKDMLANPVEVPIVIGGKEIKSEKLIEMRCPHNRSQLLGHYHQANALHANQAIDAANAAKRDWALMPWSDRATVMLKAAELLSGKYRQILNAATMLCMSKTCWQAEIDSACELIDFWRFNPYFMTQIYDDQPMSSHQVLNYMEHRPLEGFVFAITPFNFTSIAGNLPTAPALMGNAVVWKPASSAVLPAHYIMKILKEAGLPDGVINMVPGPGDTIGPPVLDHLDLGGIHFTGSTKVFSTIWLAVGSDIRKYYSYPRIVGETGGKDFIFAHASADLDALCTGLIRGAYEYQGQKCSAASRAYIPDSIWPALKERLLDQLGTLDMAVPSTVMSSEVDLFGIFEMPYLVKDRQHMARIEKDIVWPSLAPAAEKKALKILAIWENGYRHLTNNRRPIVKPEDLQGMKLRVPEGKWRVEMFKVYGANPSPMKFSELFTALQTGVIIVGFPFLMVLIGLCVSLWKSLRAETFEATLRDPLRKVVVATKHHDDVRDGS